MNKKAKSSPLCTRADVISCWSPSAVGKSTMIRTLRHLRYRPALLIGLGTAVLCGLAASYWIGPVAACLVGWDIGVLGYGIAFLAMSWHTPAKRIRQVAGLLDEGRWGMLISTVVAALASLGAIVAELARVHGAPHAGWTEGLAGITVVLSWFFIHTVFATHYAHEFWRSSSGLSFPGNDEPTYSEFLYFSFCIAVASQVSDVSTQSASMRQLVLAHSMVAYLFNTAIIALGVNIAASLAS